jgi:hypothetical protein
LGVGRFVTVPSKIWSKIPAEYETIDECLTSIKLFISNHFQTGDFLLVQGDYGATFNMVQFAKENGLIPVYATSKRYVKEVVDGEYVTTIREFKHIRFREFEG